MRQAGCLGIREGAANGLTNPSPLGSSANRIRSEWGGLSTAGDWGMLVTSEPPRYHKNVERSNANEHSFFLLGVDVYEVQDVLEMLP